MGDRGVPRDPHHYAGHHDRKGCSKRPAGDVLHSAIERWRHLPDRAGSGCDLSHATITSISPNVFFAGQTYSNVIITGTNFITPAAATTACPATVFMPTEVGLLPKALTVNSSTEITYGFQVIANVRTGEESFVAKNAGGLLQTSQPFKVDILAAPVITWANDPDGTSPTISGPNATLPNPTVVVGQQIILTTTPTTLATGIPIPLSIVSSAWKVTGGTNIGDYQPTSASTSVTLMPPLNTPGLTFYSVYPAASVQEAYQFCVGPLGEDGGSNACSPVVTATFDVSGFSTPAINIGNELLANIDDLTGCAAASGGPTLVYGNLRGPAAACGVATGTPGITFYPVGTPPGAGNFLFAQVVTGDSVVYSGASGTSTCTATPGLDGNYTYQLQINPPSTSDSPEAPLPSTNATVTRNFNATMYLLWQSTVNAKTIPVPLGYIPWAFNGTAANGGTAANPAWTASGTGAPVMSNGEASPDGVIGSNDAIPDAGSPNSAFVPATTISDIPGWNGLAVPASASCVTTTN